MPNNKTAVWLPRVLFESMLIVVSILLALGLDEWRENREDEEMIQQAMANFLREIERNRIRVDDAAPFNRGLRDVIIRRQENKDIVSTTEFIGIVGSYSPVALQSTAWETAIATGAFARMDYNLVSALSLTYSLQNRYQQLSRTGMSEIVSPQYLSNNTLDVAVYNSVQHLNEITDLETELRVVYGEVLSVVRAAWQENNPDDLTEDEPLVEAIAHP